MTTRLICMLMLLWLSTNAWAQATTPPTGATDITRAEFATVLRSMNPDGVTDQQIKVVDIGQYNVAVGILHRSGKATQNASRTAPSPRSITSSTGPGPSSPAEP